MSIYHEKTYSWTEAMRLLKESLAGIDLHTNVYFAYSEHEERYMITHDDDEVSKWIQESWTDGACELSADSEAESFFVYCYVAGENKINYPRLYEQYKPTLLTLDDPVIRKRVRVEPKYSVEFEIDIY